MNHTVVGRLKIQKIRNDSFLVNKNRGVRVWLPSSYKANSKKLYNVIYMFDGQNLFDEATSFSGEWKVDETIYECEENEHIRPSIVVGIDNSPDRLSEYLPRLSKYAIGTLGYKGQITFDYLINEVIPYVEENFNVGKTRAYRSLGGSSLGGMMTLYGGMEYTKMFSKLYCFSNSFTFYKYGEWEVPPARYGTGDNSVYKDILAFYTQPGIINKFKMAFSSGGGDSYEGECLKTTRKMVKAMLKAGWNESNLYFYEDENLEHNEYQWSLAFQQAYRFMNEK